MAKRLSPTGVRTDSSSSGRVRAQAAPRRHRPTSNITACSMIAKPHHDRWSEIATPHSDRWSENDKRYLLQLIREGEHQQQDFKYRVADACKLAKSVSAFANTDGGRLLIGVRDDGNLSGVRSEEEIYMMHQACLQILQTRSQHQVRHLSRRGAHHRHCHRSSFRAQACLCPQRGRATAGLYPHCRREYSGITRPSGHLARTTAGTRHYDDLHGHGSPTTERHVWLPN